MKAHLIQFFLALAAILLFAAGDGVAGTTYAVGACVVWALKRDAA